MKKITLLSVMAVSALFLSAQNGIPGVDYRACSTAERNNEIIDNDPAVKQVIDEANAWAEEYAKNNPDHITVDPVTGKKTILYVMPVVWHVVHNNGPENISKATIENEIFKLNQDYQLQNPDASLVHAAFASIQADVQVEFRLARLDPYGDCTEGITRTVSTITYAMDETAKSIRPTWNTNGRYYLNIWQGQSIASGAGGYAFYPGTVSMSQDGIVLIAGQLGNTVTHEVGHWLNLRHMWGNSNNPGPGNGNCSSDDLVSDTPNTEGQTGCAENTVSCSTVDNSQNYMDYNFCDVMFTNGQKTRMHAALNSNVGFRATMVSASNRTNTGTNDPYEQNPICQLMGADFTYNKDYICEGEQITFNDANTYNGTPTQWDWSFTGGTPNASSLESPTITYNTAGVYGVTYLPGNGAGWANSAAVKSNIITVNSIAADYVLPFAEGFENTTTFNNEWTIETESGNGWQNTATAAYTGSRSLRVYNYNNSSGDITEAISPSYDLSSMTNPKLKYKWSFARKVSGGNDQFIIYYSTDCGASWTIRAAKAGPSMATASATNLAFTPTNTSQWDSAEVDLGTLASEQNVRFKLYFKNSGGNNFFLDDLNIVGDASTVGVAQEEQVNNLKVFPNPMNENAVISFNLKNNINSLNIVLRDVLGKEVTRIVNNTSFTAGKYTVGIDKEKKLSSGLYFIEFNADNNVQIEKLIVK